MCPPGETFNTVSPFFERLGITRLARQTGLDDIGIPVWCAFTPNAKSIVIAQGKGLDDEAAKTSAAMEAIERAIATQPGCRVLTATRQTLQADGHLVDTLDGLLAPNQKAVVAGEKLVWAQARQLIDGDSVYVPFDAIHLDRTRAAPRYWISSDGLASGNTLDEAVLHGLLERIERDALTLWQITPPKRRYTRRIDTTTIIEPSLKEALIRIQRAGLEIALFDITTDLEIPCVVAMMAPAERSKGRLVRHVDITLGAGASTMPSIAVMRAVTEAVQSRMTFIAGARDDLLPDIFTQVASTEAVQAMDTMPETHFDDLPVLDTDSTGQALDLLLQKLPRLGINKLYAVDMTPDWLPVSVVKVLAPQLENPEGERHRRYGARALSRAF